MARPIPFTSLTDPISFEEVSMALFAVAAALIAVQVLIHGINKVRSLLGSGYSDDDYYDDTEEWEARERAREEANEWYLKNKDN